MFFLESKGFLLAHLQLLSNGNLMDSDINGGESYGMKFWDSWRILSASCILLSGWTYSDGLAGHIGNCLKSSSLVDLQNSGITEDQWFGNLLKSLARSRFTDIYNVLSEDLRELFSARHSDITHFNKKKQIKRNVQGFSKTGFSKIICNDVLIICTWSGAMHLIQILGICGSDKCRDELSFSTCKIGISLNHAMEYKK